MNESLYERFKNSRGISILDNLKMNKKMTNLLKLQDFQFDRVLSRLKNNRRGY